MPVSSEARGPTVQKPTGETVRPVWGLMNKCYTVPTQVTTPRRPGGLNAAAPKEEAAVLSQEGEQENKKVQKEVAAYPSEASEDSKEQRPWDRVYVPMTELWLDWF
eukprot:XP_011546058.1 uncharacterized protein LOC102723722 isoform X2 [Homo sapiens]